MEKFIKSYRGWIIVQQEEREYDILSKEYTMIDGKRSYYPLYCYNEYMEPQTFYDEESAERYIDEYLKGTTHRMEIRILNGREVSNVPVRMSRPI